MFLDPKTLVKDGKQLKKGFALYRIFAFSSADVIQSEMQVSIAKRLRHFSDSNTLILNYDAENVSVFDDYYGLSGVSRQTAKPIFVVNKNINFKRVNLFDRTFGEYERIQSIAVESYYWAKSFKALQRSVDTKYKIFPHGRLANYFNLFLNKSYMNFIWYQSVDNTTEYITTDLMLIPDQRKYYKELSQTYQLISDNRSL